MPKFPLLPPTLPDSSYLETYETVDPEGFLKFLETELPKKLDPKDIWHMVKRTSIDGNRHLLNWEPSRIEYMIMADKPKFTKIRRALVGKAICILVGMIWYYSERGEEVPVRDKV